MIRLIKAEFHKLFTTRLWLYLLLISMALTALYVSLTIAFSDDPDTWTVPLTTGAGRRMLFSLAASGSGTLVAVLSAIGITGEFRHRSATATFLATPRRGRVVVAKLATYGVVGIGYALANLAVTIAITLSWLAAKDIDVSLTGDGVPATFAGVIAAVAIFGLVGVGLGALLRDQVAAVVGLLIYLFVVEPILTRIPALESWTIYLPGAAKNAMTQVSLTSQEYLEPWFGGALFVAYGLAFAVAGMYLVIRRDVT